VGFGTVRQEFRDRPTGRALVTKCLGCSGGERWALGEAGDRRAPALETFAYRYREGESAYERFEVHRTVFPRDFLADFGFRTLRAQGRVELCRLELGGLQPVLEGKRAEVMTKLKEIFAPAPVPQRIP
jgi:hypothetical protein